LPLLFGFLPDADDRAGLQVNSNEFVMTELSSLPTGKQVQGVKMDEHAPEVMTAIEAAVMASALCRRVQRDLIGEVSLIKSDRSPVTIADFGSQAVVCRLIKERFPDDPIVAEEDSGELRKAAHARILEQVTTYVREHVPNTASNEICEWIDYSSHHVADRYWTVDPVDGTKGFLRGEQYAIALALVEYGVIRMGILACPNLHVDKHRPDGERGCLFLGLRGKGTVQLNREGTHRDPVSVLKVADPSEAYFTESVEVDHSDHLFHQRLAQKLNIAKPPVRMDGQTKYGIVARGEAVIYLRIPLLSESSYREKIWDHAAGTIVAEEAGGKVTDALGRPLDFSGGVRMEKNYGVVVTNGVLHDAVLKAIRPLPIEKKA
jgi:3'(2'), 5'-bisphosphate nucleotidase